MFQKKRRINLERQVKLRYEKEISDEDGDYQIYLEHNSIIPIVKCMGEDARLCNLPGSIISPRYQACVRELAERAVKKLGYQGDERLSLVEEVFELLGWFGPMWPLIEKQYSYIAICSFEHIYCPSDGVLKRYDARFYNKGHLYALIIWIACLDGQVIDEKHKTVSGLLAGYGRFHAILPPMAQNGSQLELFYDKRCAFSAEMLIQKGFMDTAMFDFLKVASKARFNVLIIGEAGAGKTTLLHLLGAEVKSYGGPVVTIGADISLSCLPALKSVCLGADEDNQRLFRQLAKIQPDAVFYDDICDYSIIQYLSLAAELGQGCVATLECRELSFLEEKIQIMANLGMHCVDHATVSHMLNHMDLLIQVNKYPDGIRRISRICHIIKDLSLLQEMNDSKENPVPSLSEDVCFADIFVWGQDRSTAEAFSATGYVPEELIQRASVNGVTMDKMMFRGNTRRSIQSAVTKSVGGGQL